MRHEITDASGNTIVFKRKPSNGRLKSKAVLKLTPDGQQFDRYTSIAKAGAFNGVYAWKMKKIIDGHQLFNGYYYILEEDYLNYLNQQY